MNIGALKRGIELVYYYLGLNMPKEYLPVSRFDRGIISNVPPTDIPREASSFQVAHANYATYNLDPNAAGKLKGLPAATTKLTGQTYYSGLSPINWIIKDDATPEYALLYNDASNTRVIQDFYGTPAASIVPYPSGANMAVHTSSITRNQEAHVGMGISLSGEWVGYIEKDQFGFANAPGFATEFDALTHDHGTDAGEFEISVVAAGAGGSFDGTSSYYWGYSLVYDGYQESPLYYASTVTEIPIAAEVVTITILADNAHSSGAANSFNDRITGIKIYRAISTTGNYEEREFFRLIGEIDIDTGGTDTEGTAITWAQVGATVDMDIDFVDNGAKNGASYEHHTGLPETLEFTMPDAYTLNTSVNDYHFITNTSLTPTGFGPDPHPETRHFLYRSKRGRFSMFDWTKDFIRLPIIPTAMVGHRGRLYIWNENSTYIIDPEGLYIEETLEGAGCVSQSTRASTDYGLFWADLNIMYRLHNNQLTTISEAIADVMLNSYTPDTVIFDSEQNFVMFYCGVNVWYYHVEKETWGYAAGIEAAVTGAFSGKDGETYTMGGSAIKRNFNGAATRVWGYNSKEFSVGEVGHDKKWYRCIINSTGTVVDSFGQEGSSTLIVFTADGEFDDPTGGDVQWVKAKTVRVHLYGIADSEVDSYEIEFRRFIKL